MLLPLHSHLKVLNHININGAYILLHPYLGKPVQTKYEFHSGLKPQLNSIKLMFFFFKDNEGRLPPHSSLCRRCLR